jgi:hypothetical protein
VKALANQTTKATDDIRQQIDLLGQATGESVGGIREIAAVIGEDESVPAEPKVRFDPAGINIYADSWRVEMGA